MAQPRFFLVAPLAETVGIVRLPLRSEDVHHAFSVLRLRKGDEIEVVEPDGSRGWRVRIEQAGSGGIDATALGRVDSVQGPGVTLIQGVAKGDKMDAIVRQAVEVGATEIMPVLTERTVVRLAGPKRAEKGERWRRVAKAAAEQSHRDAVPVVHDPVSLKDVVEALSIYDVVVVLWEECSGPGLEAVLAASAPESSTRVAVVVGPEGGLSAEEVTLLESAGAVTATLGNSILRTETAAIVALALAVHTLGGLGRG